MPFAVWQDLIALLGLPFSGRNHCDPQPQSPMLLGPDWDPIGSSPRASTLPHDYMAEQLASTIAPSVLPPWSLEPQTYRLGFPKGLSRGLSLGGWAGGKVEKCMCD